jgi:flagellin
MNAAALNLTTKIDIVADPTTTSDNTTADIKSANAAITAIDSAISSVTTQRSTLGATQNRLNYAISNLETSNENLSEANSRIRDVDMAQEMTQFTKSNILTQAATSMLAQANAMPNSVLTLLQG